MRKQLRYIIWLVLVILVITNIGLFISSIKLSDEINVFEKEIQKLHQINLELEKEISYYDSYQFAASNAANLGFTKKSTPFYLENLRYAFKK
ncbi:MAG: hypothetical protein ACK4FL_00365 [Microgenomates group bacterium]